MSSEYTPAPWLISMGLEGSDVHEVVSRSTEAPLTEALIPNLPGPPLDTLVCTHTTRMSPGSTIYCCDCSIGNCLQANAGLFWATVMVNIVEDLLTRLYTVPDESL